MNRPERTELYLDHAATTPTLAPVLEAMLPYFGETFGNPSSVHRAGQRARRALEEARERLAEAVGADPRSVIFTSGATEAINQAIFGALSSGAGGLVVGATEHPAVVAAARRLAEEGRQVTFVKPGPNGVVTPAAVEEALKQQSGNGGTALLCIMYVNNETGVIQEPQAFARLARRWGALFLCDAVQALGTEPIDFSSMGADMLTLSAHKVYGPKGAGALLLRRGFELPPMLAGGEQERGFRPGTQNVPAYVGFGVAASLASESRAGERERLKEVQAVFERAMLEIPGVSINGAAARRSVKHSSVRFAGVDGETLLMLIDAAGVRASAGSACSAGSVTPSHVLLAMGLTPEEASASLRFSFGKGTGVAEVKRAARLIHESVVAAGAPWAAS